MQATRNSMISPLLARSRRTPATYSPKSLRLPVTSPRRPFMTERTAVLKMGEQRCAMATASSSSDMALPKSFPMQIAGGKTAEIPSVGFGTWASGGTPVEPADPIWIKIALKTALETGYRHLECAWFYGVDREIGQVIRESGIPRSEIFICSKIWPNFYHPDVLELCCDKILSGMNVDYVDCLLLHWPVGFAPVSLGALKDVSASDQATYREKGMALTDAGDIIIDWKHTSEPIARAGGHPEGSIVPTWEVMKQLVRKGKTKSIGVSNFAIADLKALLPHCEDVPISVNQVEVHPWFPQRELIAFCNEHKIVISCFSPFAGQKQDGATLIKDPTVQKVARKNNVGVGQLLQSWAVQRGTVPLGKSGNEERIKANFAIQRLSDEDQKALDDLEIPDGNGRSIDFTKEWGVKLWQS